jgi:hypothetical protein
MAPPPGVGWCPGGASADTPSRGIRPVGEFFCRVFPFATGLPKQDNKNPSSISAGALSFLSLISPLPYRLKRCICPAAAEALAGTAIPQRLNDWICQYDCVHAESRHPHFHCDPVHVQT